MIRRLQLTNWRAYNDLDLELGPGTTFVVAPNGVGKTSLVEAAAWALFGELCPPSSVPVRAGAGSAVAAVEVELPDGRRLVVERTAPANATRKPAVPLVRLDGERADSSALPSILREAYGAEPAFLARVVMPPRLDPAAAGIDGPGLTQHLCQLFGVSGLSAAFAELDARLKANDRSIRAAKQGGTVSRDRLAELEAAEARAELAVGAARSEHAAARSALSAAEGARRVHDEREAWGARRDERRAALDRTSARAADLVGVRAAPDRLRDALAEEASRTGQELEGIIRELGATQGRAAALNEAGAELDRAHGDCPVCRRALDDATVRHARSVNRQDLEALALREQDLTAQAASVRARQADLRQLAAAVAQAPQPGVEPAADVPDLAAADDAVGRARDAETAAMSALVDAAARAGNASDEVTRVRADRSAHDALVGLFEQDAVLRAARSAVELTVRTVMDQTVAPLAEHIAPRWSALFPGRSTVDLDGAATMSRKVNGEVLPLETFSGGERTAALVLLRLLVAQLTTTATFCWFDEPLEHLDPDARRQVASLLTGASSSRPLRQVLVTTYEEPLAARLAADSPGRVRLVAVRSAG